MTIKTLTYIHELLKEAEKTSLGAQEVARKARNEAEEKGADNFECLDSVYHKVRESYLKASTALADFEEHDFR